MAGTRRSHVVALLGVALVTPGVLHAQESGASEMDPGVLVSLGVAVAALVVVLLMVRRARRPSRESRAGRRYDPPLIIPAARGAGAPRRALPEVPMPAPRERPPFAPAPTAAAPSHDDVVEGRTVRFFQPTDGTLQLLPGRLEIVEGADQGHNIRFVRTWGETPEITFGRNEGPPYRHVQLRSQTVSREHARMRLEEERWRITNLSQTNPVVVNGEELDGAGDGRWLSEGDRVEMGEVVFEFRNH